MPTSVNDSLPTVDERIVNAAKIIGGSGIRQTVFQRVYFGKQKLKTVKEIAKSTGLQEKVVLGAGKHLADNGVIAQTKIPKKGTAYGKDKFCASHYRKILDYAKKPTKLVKAKRELRGGSVTNININQQGVRIRVKQITCDDVDNFKLVRRINVAVKRKIPEKQFKYGIAKLARQSGDFTDWGGEPNDLYTSKIKIRGQRMPMAFAFKGPATKGKLTPGKLGKNGDQIQRLLASPADVFFVQYHDQIDESVVAQMQKLAVANSVMNNKLVLYGVIDGDDTNRLISAYPKQFKVKD
jgi:hypothetical protein